MEENKNGIPHGGQDVQAQGGANGNGGHGRRRRRKKKGGANGNGGQNGAVNQQNQQNVQNANKPQNVQNHGGQNHGGQNQPQGGKNKQQTKQKPAPQNVGKQKQADDGRKDTYAYVLDGNLYLNLTNRCSNGCDFCVRNERTSYYGNYLWLRHGDPTPDKVIAAVKGLGDITKFKEAVFCGFGEPTYRVAEMVELCDYFHEKGLSTRLNTNGQGNLINKRDIVPELKGKIDLVNVSLNASCAEKYQPICRSQFGESGFEALVEFAKLCRKNGIACRFSIVDCIGEAEVEACKRLAESVKIPLYIRKYITDS